MHLLCAVLGLFLGQQVGIAYQHHRDGTGIIHLGASVCSYAGARTMPGFLQSLIENPAARYVHLYLIIDEYMHHFLNQNQAKWSPYLHNVTVIYPTQSSIPTIDALSKHADNRFRCAILKLSFVELFPHLLHLIVVDVDTLILEDLRNLWKLWESRTKIHPQAFFGCALEVNALTAPAGYVYFNNKRHFFPPTGINTGLIALHLSALRSENVTAAAIIAANDEAVRLGDQDYLNSYTYYHPDRVVVLPCHWNKRRGSLCESEAEEALYDNQTGILHGNNAAMYAGQFWFARNLYNHYAGRFAALLAGDLNMTDQSVG